MKSQCFRFLFGSPCAFERQVRVLIHIADPLEESARADVHVAYALVKEGMKAVVQDRIS
jgi:hypothetical protein